MEEENISGDQVSEECIEQKYNANAHNDHAGNAARSLKQQQDRNAADNNIHFCERAGTQQQVVIENDMIKTDANAGKR